MALIHMWQTLVAMCSFVIGYKKGFPGGIQDTFGDELIEKSSFSIISLPIPSYHNGK